MKALVLRKPGEFGLEEKSKPVPKNDEILIKILKVGVCGTDLHAFGGHQPFFTYPRIVGHELAVQIAEIPAAARASAKNLKEGDTVAVLPYLHCGKCIACRNGKPNCCVELQCLGVHTDGGMQEYMSLPAKYLVPAGKAGAEEIAMVECFSIGFHGVRRADPKAGEAALVIGAGPIGIGVMHGLKERGAKVIVVDINDKRLEYAKNTVKADYIVNASKVDPEKAVLDLTGGENPLVVLDATGNANQMMKAFNFACQGGKIVFVGLVTADISFNDPLFHRKEISLFASRNATYEDFQNVIAGMSSGRMNTKGFVTHRSSLDQAVSEFTNWTKPETGVIKAVVEM